MTTHTRTLFLAVAIALVAGCATSASPSGGPDSELQALQQRAGMYRADAERTPDTLSPERKADLQQLASDVRAWQSRTGRDDITVTDTRKTVARRAYDGEGPGNCDSDCPAYTLDGDSICFLEKSECPTGGSPDDELQIGTICVYSCINIGSQVTPDRQGP